MYSRGLHDTFLHNYDVYRFVLDLDTDSSHPSQAAVYLGAI